jgi:virginiamycin B lyase
VVLLARDHASAQPSAPTELRVGELPTDLAVSDGQVWVASARERRVVSVLDADPPIVTSSQRTSSPPLQLAADARSVWAIGAANDTLTRLDTVHPHAPATFPIGADAVDVAIGPDGAWVTNGARGTVTRVDALSHRLIGAPILTGRFPTAVAVGDHYVWVVNSGDGTLARVDPRENLVVGRRIQVGRDPQDVAIGFGSVWVTNRADGTVTRLSSRTGRPQGAPIRVGSAPSALAITHDAVLVLASRPGALLRIDPRTRRVVRLARLRGLPSGLAITDSGAAWVVDGPSGTLTRIE